MRAPKRLSCTGSGTAQSMASLVTAFAAGAPSYDLQGLRLARRPPAQKMPQIVSVAAAGRRREIRATKALHEADQPGRLIDRGRCLSWTQCPPPDRALVYCVQCGKTAADNTGNSVCIP
jgi:hypothetical protein